MRVRVFFLCALTGLWAGLRYQLIKAIHVLQETQDLDQSQDLRLGSTLNTFSVRFAIPALRASSAWVIFKATRRTETRLPISPRMASSLSRLLIFIVVIKGELI
jgi:hypothetical protein